MMSATIEPRLIALLNEGPGLAEAFTSSPSLELPPLHDPNILKASGRPLLLEPDASTRSNKTSSGSQLGLQHSALISSIEEEEETPRRDIELRSKPGEQLSVRDRALGSSSPQALRKILDDDAGDLTISTKKRRSPDAGKDDFVQLPQPPKKQKAAKQVVPPIIIGLFEPPPQSTLFPPIASSSFHDSHGRNSLNVVPTTVDSPKERTNTTISPNLEFQKQAPTTPKKREAKTRRKWSEQETKQLLLGVHKHGVGKWTDIIGDPEFTFDNRSGVDLKDRFRTCCPVELRKEITKPKFSQKSLAPHENGDIIVEQVEPRFSMKVQRIIEENGNDPVQEALAEKCDASPVKARKSRAHRKNLTDLAELGIDGPFRKSQRRERRPFSDDDDREILEGYNLYGPAWSRIQRNPRFHLQNRQPTDLRDRFRNRYPDKFRTGEQSVTKASRADEEQEKENAAEISPISSTIHHITSRERLSIPNISSGFHPGPTVVNAMHPTVSAPSTKDTVVSMPDSTGAETYEGISFSQSSFDWAESATAPFASSISEMDISRLLLDETWVENAASNFVGKHRPSYTDINSILSSSVDAPTHGPSYYSILTCDAE